MLVLFIGVSFLSAFLMSCVQPLLGKMLLPSFGGSSSTWTTSMMFFQACLLAGYFYAFLLSKWFRPHIATLVHLAFSCLAILFIPFHADSFQVISTSQFPTIHLGILLFKKAFIPLTLLGASAPLLQWWFAHADAGKRNPYSLYISSNIGTILGLLVYPVMVEPFLGLKNQSLAWWAIWVLFGIFLVACGIAVWKSRLPEMKLPPIDMASQEPKSRFWWVLLSFIPASLMLAITARISQELPPMPMVWLVPLMVYMFTFILGFLDWKQNLWNLVLWANALALILQAFLSLAGGQSDFSQQLFLWMGTLFLVGLVCHGSLYKAKPNINGLTEFYLWIAVGGFFAGAFQALIAPLVFSDLHEYALSLSLAALAMPALPWFRQVDFMFHSRQLRWMLGLGILIALVFMILRQTEHDGWQSLVALVLIPFLPRPILFGMAYVMIMFLKIFILDASHPDLLFQDRSFYGIHRVGLGTNKKVHWLYHGSTEHGAQVTTEPGKPFFSPLVYYHPFGPVGQVLLARQQLKMNAPVGVVGLGAGSLAWYAVGGQQVDFFEIDPMVAKIASNKKLFTYLKECKGRYEVKIGDARNTLMKEPDGKYGILILDAFSSDTIPTHLLTLEAVRGFSSKLQDDGVLLFHISNRHIDLRPQLNAVAKELGLVSLVQNQSKGKISERESKSGLYPSMWVIMGKNRETIISQIATDKWEKPPEKDFMIWTDDYSSVMKAFRW